MSGESTILKNILLTCTRGACRLFRINAGQAWQGKVIAKTANTITLQDPRPFRAAPKGWPDLNGWQTITITPDMVGKRVAVFVALEVKTETGRASSEQASFVSVAKNAGAIAAVVRSPAEAQAALFNRSLF